jgi:hypothetical protein
MSRALLRALPRSRLLIIDHNISVRVSVSTQIVPYHLACRILRRGISLLPYEVMFAKLLTNLEKHMAIGQHQHLGMGIHTGCSTSSETENRYRSQMQNALSPMIVINPIVTYDTVNDESWSAYICYSVSFLSQSESVG